LLITFEGIDGCGKSTQIQLLKGYLDGKGISVHIFREPGGTALSEEIRTLLLHSKEEINPVTEMLLFSAARSQLIAEKVKPLLANDEIVILDRFYDSTTAYQGYGRSSAPIDQIKSLNEMASHGLIPDLTFYMKLSYSESRKRTEKNEKDRMELSGEAFFNRVIKGFDNLALHESRVIAIDAMKSATEIHNEIVSYLSSRFSHL
jgi:dTMP kinase